MCRWNQGRICGNVCCRSTRFASIVRDRCRPTGFVSTARLINADVSTAMPCTSWVSTIGPTAIQSLCAAGGVFAPMLSCKRKRTRRSQGAHEPTSLTGPILKLNNPHEALQPERSGLGYYFFDCQAPAPPTSAVIQPDSSGRFNTTRVNQLGVNGNVNLSVDGSHTETHVFTCIFPPGSAGWDVNSRRSNGLDILALPCR